MGSGMCRTPGMPGYHRGGGYGGWTTCGHKQQLRTYQHNGIVLISLDAVLQLRLGPPPVEPLSLTVGTKPDGAEAVCEQLEVWEGVCAWVHHPLNHCP